MRASRIPRLIALLVVLGWLAVAAVGGPLVGKLSEVQKNDNAAFLPASAESTRVVTESAAFAQGEGLPFVVVVERAGGITPADLTRVDEVATGLTSLELTGLDAGLRLEDVLSGPVVGPVPSEDRQALLVLVSIDEDRADDRYGDTSVLFETAAELRAAIQPLVDSGLTAHVTGPGGTLADFVTAFLGVDGLLLGVALGVVFVILLVVYRSPVLPVVVLLGAMFGLSLAVLVIHPLAKGGHIELSGQSQGILFILVVGAATDYALLLVARYREALHDTERVWPAMQSAWRGVAEPIVASGSTVILGLLCLLLSDLASTKGLGPVAVLGIVGAMASALTFLPAVLLVIGRRAFWPAVPRVDHVHAADKVGTRSLWGRVAGMVGSHPRRTWAITLLALVVAAAFLPTFRASGVAQTDNFLTTVDSVEGQRVLAEHFPAGSGAPVEILTPEESAPAVLELLAGENGIENPFVAPAPDAPPTVVDGRVLIQATLDEAADSPEAADIVQRLRADLDAIGTDVLVGGQTAMNLDVREASSRDLRVIVPAILIVVLLVLAVLLRSLVAPVLLIVANVLSFAATLGIAALLFNHILDFPGADASVPLYGFVFLVALGIDYSIFLMTRVREESQHHGTRRGTLIGLAVTGGVITSAGLVLAATFSALAVLPLLFLAQIAFIVGFGVLLDTLVVRSLLVPALTHDIGDRVWWPSALSRRPAEAAPARAPR